ncbi:hypothetical protein E2C01_069039 [Portunus trituberculatus]|uniref:Uncharacterized protein n=1 Tax=Portunus trituberculatus TaxID=210409 RepID=A0A5B7HZJ2_PORTR|nr:hypothetical protein [Portunus trituberculatus]
MLQLMTCHSKSRGLDWLGRHPRGLLRCFSTRWKLNLKSQLRNLKKLLQQVHSLLGQSNATSRITSAMSIRHHNTNSF